MFSKECPPTPKKFRSMVAVAQATNSFLVNPTYRSLSAGVLLRVADASIPDPGRVVAGCYSPTGYSFRSRVVS